MQPTINIALSRKLKFFSFVSMLLLVFVHGYNLNNRYMQPFTTVQEPMTVTAYIEYFFANGIFRFRIPMLFAISGYLFALNDRGAFGKRIGKRFKTLLVPYFIWSGIGLLIAVALYHWSFTKDAVSNAHLQPIFGKNFDQYKGMDWFWAYIWPTSFQLWFLRCLFFYNLLYPVLKWGLQKAPAVLFTLFTLLWLSMFGILLIEGEGLLSFTLGVWLCQRNKNVEQYPKWFSLHLFAIGFVGLAVFKTVLAFKGDSFLNPVFNSMLMILLHKAVIASGLLVAWFGLDRVVQWCMNQKRFVQASQFSFMIYALHVPLITYFIDPGFSLTNSLPNYRFINWIGLSLLTIAFCILVGWLLRSVLPKLYAVLTGNRGLAEKKQFDILPKQEVLTAPAATIPV